MIRQIITCDRCGRKEDYGTVVAAGSIFQRDANAYEKTLCLKCTKEFDAWFDKFMREGRKNEAEQG